MLQMPAQCGNHLASPVRRRVDWVCRWQIATASASAASSGRGILFHPQENPHHLLHLAFLRPAIAGDSLLDLTRRVLRHGDVGLRQREQDDAAGLADANGGGNIALEEERFDGPTLRPMHRQQLTELPMQFQEALRHRGLWQSGKHAVGHQFDPLAGLFSDQSVARAGRPRINPDRQHLPEPPRRRSGGSRDVRRLRPSPEGWRRPPGHRPDPRRPR